MKLEIKKDDLTNLHQRRDATFDVAQVLVLQAYRSLPAFLNDLCTAIDFGGRGDGRTAKAKRHEIARIALLKAAEEFCASRK